MLKGFPPLLPLHAVTPPIKAILKMIKKKCSLLRLMVFLQKSGRLYQKAGQPGFPHREALFGIEHCDCCIWAR